MEDQVPAMEAGNRQAVEPVGAAKLVLRASACALALLSGCVTPGKIPILAGVSDKVGSPVQMGVIAEPRAVEQNGQKVDGLVVQVLLLDAGGRPCRADGGISFSVYREDGVAKSKVEADRQWTFSAEDVSRGQARIPLGVVHNFWLPLNGRLAGAKKLEMFSAYSAANGVQLTQVNRISMELKSMKVEKTSDVDGLAAKVMASKQEAESPPSATVAIESHEDQTAARSTKRLSKESLARTSIR